MFGLTDWYRDGTLGEYVAMEARNLAPLPGDVDFIGTERLRRMTAAAHGSDERTVFQLVGGNHDFLRTDPDGLRRHRQRPSSRDIPEA